MTGPEGNSEFCFPKTLNVPSTMFPQQYSLNNIPSTMLGNIEVEGKQNSMFPAGPVIKCFVLSPNSKIKKTAKKLFA